MNSVSMGAIFLAHETWEILGLVAVLATIVGLWLNWQRSWHIADLEEDVKNGKISEEQGWRRARWVHWRATTVLVLGVTLLIAASVGLLA